MFADLQNKYIDLYFFFVVFQLNFYFAQYWLLQSKLCTMIDVQTNSITADFTYIPIDDLYAYFPFDWDLLDHKNDLWASGSPLSMSTFWTVSFTSWKVWQAGVFNNSWLHWNWIRTWNVSIMFRAYRTWSIDNSYQWLVIDHGYLWLFARWSVDQITQYNWWNAQWTWIVQMQYNQRYFCAIVGNGSQCYVFINWTKYWPYWMWTSSSSSDRWLRIWMWTSNWQKFTWYIDEVLVYKRLLTDEEVLKYYNKTK